MARARKSFVSGNGFRVAEFCCDRQPNGCTNIGRIYYPQGNEVYHVVTPVAKRSKSNVTSNKGEQSLYKIMDQHEGAVIIQILRPHSCSRPLSWVVQLKSNSSTGLHPTLKEAIHREADRDPYRLPKPTTMLSCIKEQFSHDIDVLFPSGCVDIVSNQIT
jgi:hypothetical protein